MGLCRLERATLLYGGTWNTLGKWHKIRKRSRLDGSITRKPRVVKSQDKEGLRSR